MKYISREAENAIKKLVDNFKVVLLTGPRQVGKSTLLKELYKDEYKYISLDDINQLQMAKTDPKLFFINNPGKLIIDEVQYSPEIFMEIKRIVDQSDDYGQFILTGSQTFSLMKNVSESLAGRVGIMELKPLSSREIISSNKSKPFVPSIKSIQNKIENIDFSRLWQIIHRGSFPELYKNPNLDWEMFYSSYITTFIQRDVRQITAVQDLDIFTRFISVLAARISQEVNYSSIAQEVGVDQKTIKSWMGILQASGIIYIIPTFANNQLKRVTKSPVMYFCDTGLVAYLGRWTTPDVLRNGAFAGPILENYCVSEIIKSYSNLGKTNYPIYFYRDKDQREIDIIIEDSGVLYPVEIKNTANPNANMAKNMYVLNKAEGYTIGLKCILAQVERNYLIKEDIIVNSVMDI